MALKPVYKDTRGDKNRLLRDVRPGDKLYVIHDIAGRYVMGVGKHGYDDPQVYSEYEVIPDTAPFTGHPMVRNTRNGGTESVSQLHCHEREIHTVLPTHLRNRADDTQTATNRQIAKGANRAHANDTARDNSAKKTLAAASTKRRWF